ncbi:MAG: T9SS type A sorting domain-containing protein [Bacteroidia bacterium]|nr:T9SS type A sorting domain-containing protein [Bacteroidia bacterium]
MKNLIYSLAALLCFLPALTFGQAHPEKSFGDFFNNPVNSAVWHPTGGFVFAGSVGRDDQTLIFQTNLAGDTLKVAQNTGWSGYNRLLTTSLDGNFFVQSYVNGCDFAFGSKFQKLDQNLNQIWSTQTPFGGVWTELNDSNLICVHDNPYDVSFLFPDGTMDINASGLPLFSSPPIKLITLDSTNFLSLQANKLSSWVHHFWPWNSNFLEFPATFTGNLVDLEKGQNQNLWLAKDLKILHLHPNYPTLQTQTFSLTPLDSVDLQGSFSEIIDINPDLNAIWVLGKDLNGLAALAKVDTNLNLIYLKSLGDAQVEAKGTLTAASGVYVYGNENLKYARHGFVKEFDPATGATDLSSNDAGISGMTISNATLVEFGPSSFNCQVEITNYGQDILYSVDVNLMLKIGSFCYYDYVFNHIDTLSLSPGQSTMIDLGLIVRQDLFNENWLDSICAFTSSPNGKIDDGHSNDLYCSNQPWVGLEEDLEANLFALYPNPASGTVTLSMPGKLAQSGTLAEFTDLQGRVIFQTEITSDKQQIQLPASLNQGIFLVNLKSKAGDLLATQKLVVY